MLTIVVFSTSRAPRALWGVPGGALELPFPRQARGKGHREHAQGSLKQPFPRQAGGKGNREGPKLVPRIIRKGTLLGRLATPLKLPFPRQAGRKGYCEHSQRVPKLPFPRQAEGKGYRDGGKMERRSVRQEPPWGPKASKIRVLSLGVPFSPCWSRKTFVGSQICHFAWFALFLLPVGRKGRARKKVSFKLPSRPPETPRVRDPDP